MYTGLKSIRYERAKLERNRVLMTSMMEDANISETMNLVHKEKFYESVDDAEIEALIDQLPESDTDDAEIERFAPLAVLTS